MAKAYAKAKAQQEYLENFKHSKRSILMKKAQSTGIESAAAQEREALADPEYDSFLRGLQAATEESEKLNWELKIAMTRVDVWRSIESSRRAERKGYGA